MDNIEDLLRALVGDDDDGCGDIDRCNYGERCEEHSSHSCGKCGEENGGQPEDLFSGLDPEMLIKLMGLLEILNQPDDSERFLLALKPLLRKENRPKVDSALRLIKLFSMLPVLREAGILDKLV